MKKALLVLAAFLVVLLLVSKLTSIKAEGTWQAELIVDNGIDTLDINVSEISLKIDQGHYYFHSTLNKIEQGTIVQSGKELVLTNSENDSTYKVDILQLSKTQLHLRMYGNNQVRQIHFSKAK